MYAITKTIISSIIVLVLLLPHIYYEYIFHENMQKAKYEDLADGDVVMFKYDQPILYYKNGKRNSSLYVTKYLQSSIVSWFHMNPYTHTGIVVSYSGKKYVAHLTSDPFFDNYSKTWKVGDPVLSSLEDLYSYVGCLYLHKYNGTVQPLDLSHLPEVHIRNDILDAVVEHVFKVQVDKKYISCAALVEHIQGMMGIRHSPSNCADLNTVVGSGYSQVPMMIPTPWSISRGF